MLSVFFLYDLFKEESYLIGLQLEFQVGLQWLVVYLEVGLVYYVGSFRGKGINDIVLGRG